MGEKMKISKRLMKVAGFVSHGNKLADIGTDHGYVPIYLIQNGVIPKAIAMDINQGPLERAKENILANGLKDKITVRISDGLDQLNFNEADTILIAGMGGALVVNIMARGLEVLNSAKELVLSPHSELDLVRHFLCENNFKIIEEEMFKDEGKFYTVIKAIRGNMVYSKEIYYKYGKFLLERKNQTLKEFLIKEKNTYTRLLEHLCNNGNASDRAAEIEGILQEIEDSLQYFID